MATKVYSSSAFLITSAVRCKPWFSYTTSETSTQYKITLTSGIYVRNTNTTASVTHSVSGTLHLTGTGQTSKTSSFTVTSTKDGVDKLVISSFTWTWNKGTSAASKTVTAYVNNSSASYIASKTFTVPALASGTVTYNANSGSGAPASQTRYYNTALRLQSGKPTKTGYTFKGWATSSSDAADPTGKTIYQPSGTLPATTGTLSITLYAVWELAYTKPIIQSVSVERCAPFVTEDTSPIDGKRYYSMGQDRVLTLEEDTEGKNPYNEGWYECKEDDEGKYALVKFNWSVYRSSNSRYYGGSGTPYANNTIQSCSITVGTEDPVTVTSSDGSGSVSEVIGSNNFNVDNIYPVTITLTDSQTVYTTTNTTIVDSQLTTAHFPIDVNADGTAIAFLMPAPDPQSAQDDVSGVYVGTNVYLTLDTTAASGTDYDIYQSLTVLEWDSDVIV